MVTYRPSSANLDSFAAVLQPLDLPPEAMPGYSADDDETAEPALEVGLRLVGRGEGRDLRTYPSALLGSDATKGEEVTPTTTLTLTLTLTLYLPLVHPNPNTLPQPCP